MAISGAASGPSWAAQADDRAERQAEINAILHSKNAATVASDRLMCATGIRGGMMAAEESAFGQVGLPNRLADLCMAALRRSAQDGRFTVAVRQNSAPGALALDQAFMSAYQKHEPVPMSLPDIATLKPIAQRCFAGSEPRTGLCSATGYALGARVAGGETIGPG